MLDFERDTLLRLAENVAKITEKEFDVLREYQAQKTWTTADDFESLVNEYVTEKLDISDFY